MSEYLLNVDRLVEIYNHILRRDISKMWRAAKILKADNDFKSGAPFILSYQAETFWNFPTVGSHIARVGLMWQEPGLNLLDGMNTGITVLMCNCNVMKTWPYLAPTHALTYLKWVEWGRNEINVVGMLLVPESRKNLHILYVSPCFKFSRVKGWKR